VIAPNVLAVAVAAGVALIMALGLVGALVDHYLAVRAMSEAERLRAHIEALEATKAELEATSTNLRHALIAADSASQAKSQFLAAMSHELRTPLNAVIGFSEMLTMELYGPLGNRRYHEFAGNIKSSGAHLLSLISDILDLSQVDAGKMDLRDEEISIDELIEPVLSMMQAQSVTARVGFGTRVEEDLPWIRVDRRRIHQVLINLVSNAIKFTPAGGQVKLSAAREGDGVAISVSDTGIGIAPADIPKVFERFRQLDSRLARKYEGTGLGLPLARELMELHGGTIGLESQVDKGTVVTITLPAERIIPARAKAAPVLEAAQ
jgi:signal transduction histidine kinase